MIPNRRFPHSLALLTLAGAGALMTTAARALEPTTVECLAAHDQATSARTRGELRSSRLQLQLCAAATCPTGIQRACADEMKQVSSAIPTLILDAVDAAGNDVSAVKVTVDGQPLLERIDGSAVAVDPGPHRFSFEVAGRRPEVKTLVMEEGAKDRRVRIEIAPPPPPPSHEGETQRTIGLAFGAAGVVSAGLATIFGLSARSNLARSHADCGATVCANEPQAASELSTATSQATISTGGFIAAGAFLATGAMLYFTAPKTQRSSNAALSISPAVGPSAGSLLLRGVF